MELCEGGTLKELLMDEELMLEQEELLRLAAETATGIAYLHMVCAQSALAAEPNRQQVLPPAGTVGCTHSSQGCSVHQLRVHSHTVAQPTHSPSAAMHSSPEEALLPPAARSPLWPSCMVTSRRRMCC